MSARDRVLAAALLLSACGEPAAPSGPASAAPSSAPAPASEPASPPAAAVTELDARDAYALLAAIETAEASDEDALGPALEAVRSDWEGHRYRWEAMRVDGLCVSAATCLVAPFDLGRFDHPVHASFLPAVAMSEAEFAHLGELCAPHTGGCVFTFEGTLETLELSLAAPTSMHLSEAHVVSARPLREGEYYLSRPPIVFDHGAGPLHPLRTLARAAASAE